MLVLSLVGFALFLVALIDILLSKPEQIRYLPKTAWIVIVIVLPLLGSILWYALGRAPRAARQPRPARTGRQPRTIIVHESAPVSRTPSTEEQLAAVEREIADDRIRRLEDELRQRSEDSAA